MSGTCLQKVPTIPEWNDFMQLARKVNNKETVLVTFLSFINSPPTEYSNVHTKLQYALKSKQDIGAIVCYVRPAFVLKG